MQRLADIDRGLELLVELPTVADGRYVEGVEGVVDRVVNMESLPVVVGNLLEPGIFYGVAEAGPCLHGAPAARVVETDMPGSGSTHGEAAQDNPGGIDSVLAFDRGESLVDIDLACPAVGVVGPAEDVQLEMFACRGLPGIMLGQEADLAEASVASVKDQVEAKGGLPIVVLWYDQAVGLDAFVDF